MLRRTAFLSVCRRRMGGGEEGRRSRIRSRSLFALLRDSLHERSFVWGIVVEALAVCVRARASACVCASAGHVRVVIVPCVCVCVCVCVFPSPSRLCLFALSRSLCLSLCVSLCVCPCCACAHAGYSREHSELKCDKCGFTTFIETTMQYHLMVSTLVQDHLI